GDLCAGLPVEADDVNLEHRDVGRSGTGGSERPADVLQGGFCLRTDVFPTDRTPPRVAGRLARDPDQTSVRRGDDLGESELRAGEQIGGLDVLDHGDSSRHQMPDTRSTLPVVAAIRSLAISVYSGEFAHRSNARRSGNSRSTTFWCGHVPSRTTGASSA